MDPPTIKEYADTLAKRAGQIPRVNNPFTGGLPPGVDMRPPTEAEVLAVRNQPKPVERDWVTVTRGSLTRRGEDIYDPIPAHVRDSVQRQPTQTPLEHLGGGAILARSATLIPPSTDSRRRTKQ